MPLSCGVEYRNGDGVRRPASTVAVLVCLDGAYAGMFQDQVRSVFQVIDDQPLLVIVGYRLADEPAGLFEVRVA